MVLPEVAEVPGDLAVVAEVLPEVAEVLPEVAEVLEMVAEVPEVLSHGHSYSGTSCRVGGPASPDGGLSPTIQSG